MFNSGVVKRQASQYIYIYILSARSGFGANTWAPKLKSLDCTASFDLKEIEILENHELRSKFLIINLQSLLLILQMFVTPTSKSEKVIHEDEDF